MLQIYTLNARNALENDGPSPVKRGYRHVASNRRIWLSDKFDESKKPCCVIGQIRPREKRNANECDAYSQGGRIKELRKFENKTKTKSDNNPPNYSRNQIEFIIEFTLTADGPADEPDIQNRSRRTDPI
jgi:hypothetical protein